MNIGGEVITEDTAIITALTTMATIVDVALLKQSLLPKNLTRASMSIVTVDGAVTTAAGEDMPLITADTTATTADVVLPKKIRAPSSTATAVGEDIIVRTITVDITGLTGVKQRMTH